MLYSSETLRLRKDEILSRAERAICVVKLIEKEQPNTCRWKKGKNNYTRMPLTQKNGEIARDMWCSLSPSLTEAKTHLKDWIFLSVSHIED